MVCFLTPQAFVIAQTIDELKTKITDRGGEIRALQAEIDKLNKNVQDTTAKRQTLDTELRQIDAIKKKLDTDVKITNKKIELATLNIRHLSGAITDKQERIETGLAGLSGSLKLISETDKITIPIQILSGDNLSFLWNKISQLEDLQNGIVTHNSQLIELKNELRVNKSELEDQKVSQIFLKNQLSDQQKIAAQNVVLKNNLVTETKNQESNFKKLLIETEAKKRGVEDELLQFESELQIIIDPRSLPTSGTKVLAWPLTSVFITQYFGNTEFSKTQSIYNGKGHSGIDLRAPVGTPLYASGGGIVLGSGDTDPVCYGASYGKWIMIDHENGLSSIFGHLSLIKVKAGDRVNTGDLIGYTGKSGYALGPHLHYTVAATRAVQIGSLKSKVRGCGTYIIPLGSLNGYLNPLLYL